MIRTFLSLLLFFAPALSFAHQLIYCEIHNDTDPKVIGVLTIDLREEVGEIRAGFIDANSTPGNQMKYYVIELLKGYTLINNQVIRVHSPPNNHGGGNRDVLVADKKADGKYYGLFLNSVGRSVVCEKF